MTIFAILRRYATGAWYHRWKGIAFAWLVCLLGWTVLGTIPDRFQAAARVSADPNALLNTLLRGFAVEASPSHQMEMLQRTLLSRANLERIIAETGLRDRVATDAQREVLVRDLAREIRFAQPARNLLAVEYRDSAARVAYEVVRATLDLLLQDVANSERQQMASARQFVDEQIASHEQRLREAGRLRFEFQSRYQDLLPGPNGAPSRLETLRTRLQEQRGELADSQSRRELTQRQLDAAPRMLSEGDVTEAAAPLRPGINDLADAERNLRELRLRYTEQHPDVVLARRLVSELRANGGGSGGFASASRAISRPNPLYGQLRVRMMDAEAQTSALERQVTEGATELIRLEALAQEEADPQARFTALDRNYNVVRRNYEELLTRRETLQISDATPERAKVEVVDRPEVPSVPVAPKRTLLAASVLLAGLAAGAGLALALVRFDGAFYSMQDLRRLGLPVIGGISSPDASRLVSLRGILSFALALGLLAGAFGGVLAGPDKLARRTGLTDFLARQG